MKIGRRTLLASTATAALLHGGGAIGGFLNGNGAIYMTGTWRIDDFLAAEAKPDSPLHEGYTARVFPNLFKTQSVWTDNHSWVLPKGGTNAETRKAALTFLKFVWDRTAEWSRTGHLPVSKTVAQSEAFRALPQRERLRLGFFVCSLLALCFTAAYASHTLMPGTEAPGWVRSWIYSFGPILLPVLAAAFMLRLPRPLGE